MTDRTSKAAKQLADVYYDALTVHQIFLVGTKAAVPNDFYDANEDILDVVLKFFPEYENWKEFSDAMVDTFNAVDGKALALIADHVSKNKDIYS